MSYIPVKIKDDELGLDARHGGGMCWQLPGTSTAAHLEVSRLAFGRGNHSFGSLKARPKQTQTGSGALDTTRTLLVAVLRATTTTFG